MFIILKSILLASVTALLIFTGFKAYESSTDFTDLTKYISHNNTTQQKIQKKIDKILEELSLGIYDKHSKSKKTISRMQDKAEKLHKLANIYLYLFFGIYLLFAFIFFLIDREFVSVLTGTAALIALFFAIFSPLVMISVYKNLPFIGNVTLSYESKSIVTTIEKLFRDSNYILAAVVFLFSIAIPLLKSLLIIVYGFLKEHDFANKMANFIEKIGKWSMADVFIVALLVVLFSTKQDIYTTLQLQIGLYFFTGYVILSMIGSGLLKNEDTDS